MKKEDKKERLEKIDGEIKRVKQLKSHLIHLLHRPAIPELMRNQFLDSIGNETVLVKSPVGSSNHKPNKNEQEKTFLVYGDDFYKLAQQSVDFADFCHFIFHIIEDSVFLLSLYKYEIDGYVRLLGQKLKNTSRLAKSIDRFVLLGKKTKDYTIKETVLLRLVGADPRWLFEPWIKQIVAKNSGQENRQFFNRLGATIGDEKKKAYRPKEKAGTKATLSYIKENMSFRAFLRSYECQDKFFHPQSVADLLDHLISLGKCNPEWEPKSFRRLLERHYLLPHGIPPPIKK